MSANSPIAPIALIFDMDGTMVDSMPYHTQSWLEFARRHGVVMDVQDLLSRTTGRTGVECMGEVFGRTMSAEEALPLVHEKEAIYRELFAPVFREVKGFKAFAAKARSMGCKIGVGTAGDAANVAFAMAHLQMPNPPTVIVRGDQGLKGKPDPAIFLKAAYDLQTVTSSSIVFEDAPFGIEAARRAGMRAVAICSSHTAAELAGPHVIATVQDYTQLPPDFLDKLLTEKH
jgi:beta-phosphoglucomutase-like phosphatase (HAD superfamily)